MTRNRPCPARFRRIWWQGPGASAFRLDLGRHYRACRIPIRRSPPLNRGSGLLTYLSAHSTHHRQVLGELSLRCSIALPWVSVCTAHAESRTFRDSSDKRAIYYQFVKGFGSGWCFMILQSFCWRSGGSLWDRSKTHLFGIRCRDSLPEPLWIKVRKVAGRPACGFRYRLGKLPRSFGRARWAVVCTWQKRLPSPSLPRSRHLSYTCQRRRRGIFLFDLTSTQQVIAESGNLALV